YAELHRIGAAHSVEVWQEGALVGGLYGVAIGGYFAGESQFRLVNNAAPAQARPPVREPAPERLRAARRAVPQAAPAADGRVRDHARGVQAATGRGHRAAGHAAAGGRGGLTRWTGGRPVSSHPPIAWMKRTPFRPAPAPPSTRPDPCPTPSCPVPPFPPPPWPCSSRCCWRPAV